MNSKHATQNQGQAGGGGSLVEDVLAEAESRWPGNLWLQLHRGSVRPPWLRSLTEGWMLPELVDLLSLSWSEAFPELGPDDYRKSVPAIRSMAQRIQFTQPAPGQARGGFLSQRRTAWRARRCATAKYAASAARGGRQPFPAQARDRRETASCTCYAPGAVRQGSVKPLRQSRHSLV